MTKEEMVEKLQAAGELKGVTFDYALPEPWVQKMREKGVEVTGTHIWIYPNWAPTFGEPYDLVANYTEHGIS